MVYNKNTDIVSTSDIWLLIHNSNGILDSERGESCNFYHFSLISEWQVISRRHNISIMCLQAEQNAGMGFKQSGVYTINWEQTNTFMIASWHGNYFRITGHRCCYMFLDNTDGWHCNWMNGTCLLFTVWCLDNVRKWWLYLMMTISDDICKVSVNGKENSQHLADW